MKRTQLKDALRNIWKQKVSYLSVIVIAFLGVATFLGISFSDAALRRNGSIMYNAVNYRDLEIMSTALFTEEDLEEIRYVEGVEDAEAVWQTNAKVYSDDKRQDISVITLTERVNQPQIIEGRLPEAADECAVEQRLAQDMGWQVNDAIRTATAKGDTAEYLKEGVFLIVGIANHPDHTSMSIPDTLYVMVQKDAFDMEALDDCFMKAEIVIDKPEGIDRFTKKYETAVDAVSERLEQLAARRVPIRDGEVQGRAKSQLDEAQTELDNAYDQLQQVRADLDKGWTALQDGETQIGDNEAKLNDARTQLKNTYDQLQEAGPQLDEAKTKLDKAKKELSNGRKALKKGRTQLDQVRMELIDTWYSLEDAKEKVRTGIRTGLGSYANQINWASRQSVNVDNASETAMEFWITDTFKFDLDESVYVNIRRLINSGEIPDEALVELYNEYNDTRRISSLVKQFRELVNLFSELKKSLLAEYSKLTGG